MKIFGIGIDILEIKRIKKIFINKKNMFAKKILSKNEIIEYKKKNNKIYFLAKKFTAKEAVVKALGTGISNGIYFKNIEIYHNKKGKPKIKFLKKTKYYLKKIKFKKIHISITDEKKYVLSTVIIEN